MRVIYIGEDPDTVDTSDPAIPDGVTPDSIRAGLDEALKAMRSRGWTAEFCEVPPEPVAAVAAAEPKLREGWDVVLFGGGLRLPPKRAALFEALVNAARRVAPQAVFAFNNAPGESVEAVERALA